MTVKKNISELSWIKPRFDWSEYEETFACVADADDVDLVQIVAAGLLSVSVVKKRLAKPMAALLSGSRSTTGACLVASAGFLAMSAGKSVTFYLHDIFALPESRLLVILGQGRPAIRKVPQGLRHAAIRLALEYRRKDRQAKKEEEDRKKAIRDNASLAPDYRNALLADYDRFPTPRPQARFSELQVELEPVTYAPRLPKSNRLAEKIITDVVLGAGRPLSRAGRYACERYRSFDGSWCAVVRWEPRTEYTPALELKAAAEAVFSSAFSKPRVHAVVPPEKIDGEVEQSTTRSETSIDDAEDLNQEALFESLPGATGEGKDLLRSGGFEAIAWYQAFHNYVDESWGIYFDAARLDVAVKDFGYDLRRYSSQPHELSARLFMRLATAHELFHARVEFAATWLELDARRKRYLPYNKAVYQACRLTENWLEEALANWCARRWFLEAAPDWKFRGLIWDVAGVERVIEDWLDLSPPGYSHWRKGNDHNTWRDLASELRTGVPSSQGRKRDQLPFESLLRSAQVIDLRVDDVPLHFVGRGVVADAYFSSPSRREVLRVLSLYGYKALPERGKGSHEVWRGPDGRIFPVPVRDPLSLTVFRTLLHHFGWTKKQYLSEIRSRI